MDRIQIIIRKEWAEVFKNRAILMTVIIMPLVFTILPLGVLIFMHSMGSGGDSADVPAQFAMACGSSLSATDCLQVYLLNEFLIMYMMMPLMIPIAFAAYSIVGEKTTRSLEPLLATPITTMELLVGKGLAAVIPAILATWGCFIIFVVGAAIIGISDAVRGYIAGPVWMGAIFFIGPLMAVASVNMAVIVSSRVTDPRIAEQISSVMIVPLLIVLFGQVAGIIVLDGKLIFLSGLVLIAVDAGLVYLGVKMFDRETILTKWR